jgi:general secretion pathway protein L
MASIAETLPRPMPAWRLRLGAFWRWWVAELAQLVPDRVARRARVPVLAFEGGDLVLVEPRTSPESRVNAENLASAAARAAVAQTLERAGETRARARLALGRDEALVRRVSMPAATEENLREVVGFEMDRLTPFRAEEVYFDQRVVTRDAGSGQIGVEFAVAMRERVDGAIKRLRDLGVSVQGVVLRDSPAFDLLPSEQRGERDAPREMLIRNALVGGVIVLLLVALLLPAWQKREAMIALYPAIAKAKQEAEATDGVVRALERQVADYNFMMAKRHAAPTLAYVEEVSRLLPDNTWVQQLEVRNTAKSREIQITGETTSASKLIEILEQSTLLQNSAPKGAVTRGSLPGTERFMIVAEAKSRPLPEMLALKDIAALPPRLAPLPPPAPMVEATQEPAAAPPATAAVDVEAAPPVVRVVPPPAPIASDRPPAETGEIAKLLARQAEDRRDAEPADALKARMAERVRRAQEAQRQSQAQKPGAKP